MWLVKKFKEKFKYFNVKWNINCKKSQWIKFLNMKNYILEKFQCILQLNYSFYGGLFLFLFWYYYDIFFESTFFIF
jgi:hypothetical protein